MPYLRSLKIVGLLVLLYLLWQTDWVALEAILAQARLDYLVIATCLLVPHLLLKALRWHYLLTLQGCALPLRRSISFYLSALYWGVVTPGRAGELIKVFYLVDTGVTDYGHGLASVLTDRLLDLFALSIVAFASLWWLYPTGLAGLAAPLGLIATIVLLFVVASRRFLPHIFAFIRGKKTVGESQLGRTAQHFVEGMVQLRTRKLSAAISLTLLAQLLFFYQCFLIALSVGMEITPEMLCAGVSLSSLVGLLPITIMGLGTREATLLHTWSPIGVGLEQILAYASLDILIFYLGTACLGYCISWISPLRGPDQASS